MASTADRTMRPKPNRRANEGQSNEETDAEYYVLGGEHLGASIARRLRAAGHSVCFIDETHGPGELPGRRGDPLDVELLEDVGVSEASTVVAATPHDGRNLLIAQLARTRLGVSDVLVLVNHPDRHDPVVEVGHETVCATSVLSGEIVAGLDAAKDEADPRS